MTMPEILDWARKTRLRSLGETYRQDFNSEHIMNIRDYLKMLIDNAEIVISDTKRVNACMNNVQDAINYLKKCGVICPGNVREDKPTSDVKKDVPLETPVETTASPVQSERPRDPFRPSTWKK